MPSSIDLASIGFGVDDHRRDQWGRMLVVPPDADIAIGYTRVTTVAKALDDGGGLAPWKASLSIVGSLRRPGLRARWEALIAATGGDPWYSSKASKAECKKLVESCAEAGGSTDRAEQGTSLHALTALVDVGESVTGLLPETERDVEAYVNGLADEGITIATNASSGLPCVELTTVLDRHRVAGTADRVVNVPGFERPLIADLKTGADLGYSWNSIAVQLAAYANGDAEYWQGADPNGSEDMRSAMPDVDREHGLVIHLPAGEGRCDLYVLDLVGGWAAFELSMAARAWRGRRDLTVKLPPRAQRIKILEVERPTLTLLPTTDNYADQQIEADEALGVEQPSTWDPWQQHVVDVALEVDVVSKLVDEPFVTEHEQRQLNQSPAGAYQDHPSRSATGTPFNDVADAGRSLPPLVSPDMFAALDTAVQSHPAAHQRPVQAPQSDADDGELRAWLQQRVDVAGAHSDLARADLVRSWPADVPALKSAGHRPDQLAAIERVLDDVEARHSIPFGPTKPGSSTDPDHWVRRLFGEFPNSTIITKEQP